MVPRGGPREWRPAIFVHPVGIDLLSLQKHLYYPLMPIPSGPRERRSAISGVCLVGFEVPLFQQYLYNLLMSPSSCPRESCTPHAIGCINIPFLHLQYSNNYSRDPEKC